MSGRQALVVDVGSSSVKTATVDLGEPGAEPAALREYSTPQPLPARPGRHETDPEAFGDLVCSVIDTAVSENKRIAAVAFSTQMHGVLLADSVNVPLSPFLSWQDERALDETPAGSVLERVSRAVPSEVLATSGIPMRVGIGAATLARWIEENDVHVEARVHTLGSYLLCRLRGPYATHVTNAAPLGLVDLRTGRWNTELVAAYGLDGFELPAIVEGYGAHGTAVLGGRSVELFPDLGDHQASVLGSGLEDGEFAVSLGTAGIGARIAVAADAQPGVEVRPYIDGRFLHVRSRLPGGRLATQFSAAFAELAQVAGTDVAAAEFWTHVLPAQHGLWGRVVDDFLDRYVVAYRKASGELFPESAGPRRMRINGGMSQHIPWFHDGFGSSIGLHTVEAPTGDLAVRGIARLLTNNHVEES